MYKMLKECQVSI